MRSRVAIAVAALLVPVVGACSKQDVDAYTAEATMPNGAELKPLRTFDGAFGKVVDAAVSERGDVYVADRQAAQIVAFDSLGEEVGVIGRRGDGPGEFQYVTDITIFRDSLFVLDHGLGRVTGFSLRDPEAPPYSAAIRTSGGWSPGFEVLPSDDGTMFVIFQRPSVSHDTIWSGDPIIRRVSRMGEVAQDSVAVVSGIQWLVTDLGGATVTESMPFGHRGFLEYGSPGVIVEARTDRRFLRRFDSRGEQVGSVPLPLSGARPVTEEDVRHYVSTFEPGFLGEKKGERILRAAEEGRLPETFPLFIGIVSDMVGGFWLQPVTPEHDLERGYYGPELRAPENVLVRIDGSGKTVLRAHVAANGQLVAARGGVVYLLTTDDLGVERVRSFGPR